MATVAPSSLACRRSPLLDRLELGLEAVLGAVRLVGDDDDVAALRQQRVGVFVVAGHELLDRGEHDAVRRPLAQQRAQLLAGGGLHRPLAQQVLGQREHAEQLAVQIVAVGDDNAGRVGSRRLAHHAGGKAGHGDAFAAALGVPDHAAFLRSTGP
jgi:hypothetical protein